MNVILRCGCGGVTTYVKNSMGLLKLSPADQEIVGKEKIRKFSTGFPQGPVRSHLDVIAKKSGRYAYYLSLGENNEMTALYNLIKGQKVY